MNPWTDEVDRLRRHLAELDALIFGAAGSSAELRAVRARQNGQAGAVEKQNSGC
jgi:hypothetical protein